MKNLRTVCFFRHPDAWSWELDAIANRASDASDPARAQSLLQKGRKAEGEGKRGEVERVVRELWQLLPADREDRALGFESGVR